MATSVDDVNVLLAASQNGQEQTQKKPKHRMRLPAKMFDRSQISIWSILKQFIGKELSKIAMPASFCEPLSLLQRVSENSYYSHLLDRAAASPDPCKRMEWIAAYAVTGISANIDRLSKPFNPLLGETYELDREDLGFKIILEQVSHHPPISAFHSESTREKNWSFYGVMCPKVKFWGKSMEVKPMGTLTVELNNHNERYTWHSVTSCVHNIIVGKLWFEYYGTMEIVCQQTGYKAVVNFKPYSWTNKEVHKVEGFIYDDKKTKVRALYGYWTHCLYACDAHSYESYTRSGKSLPLVQLDPHFNALNSPQNAIFETHSHPDLTSLASSTTNNKVKFGLNGDLSPTSDGKTTAASGGLDNSLNKGTTANKLRRMDAAASSPAFATPAVLKHQLSNLIELWRVVPRPPYAADYYCFNYFTMTLNELTEDMEKTIAPTDSRFRTDVRQLELGNLDGATSEKLRLEEKQRESRKTQLDYKPKWFAPGKHKDTQEDIWVFNHKYWLRDYSECPHLY